MKKLSLREKIGQLIFTGFPGPRISNDLKKLITEYKIGNIILFTPNVENKAQLTSLCTQLQQLILENTGHPALLSIDQEGGRVTRLPHDASNIPGAMAIASTGRPENAYAAGRITAREMRALGINFNLAPVLDINNNKQNPVINVRSYGDSAEAVQDYGLQMMKGLKDGGVLAAIKHFPGHGDTAVDSHLGLPVIDKALDKLMELELKPFEAAIAQGAECITSAHILFPSIEKDQVPATMSRILITNILKDQMGYQGLIISDCLEMNAIQKFYGTAQGAVGALKAGVHMIFISHTPSLVIEAVERIEQAVLSGELSMTVLDEAVEKVLYYKRKYRVDESDLDLSLVGCSTHRRAIEAMSQESICLVHGKLKVLEKKDTNTIFIGSLSYRTDLASSGVGPGLAFSAVMAEAFSTDHLMVNIDPDPKEMDQVISQLKSYSRIVYGLYNAIDNTGQLALLKKLMANGHEIIAVALGKPYDLDGLEGDYCGLAAFEYTPLAIHSLIQVLSGAYVPTGKLSIKG